MGKYGVTDRRGDATAGVRRNLPPTPLAAQHVVLAHKETEKPTNRHLKPPPLSLSSTKTKTQILPSTSFAL